MSRLLVPVLALSAALAAQAPPPASTGVRLDLRALRDGQIVPDLQPDDLRVLEDGVPQNIDTLQFVSSGSPRAIVVVLDTLHGDLRTPGPLNVVRLLERATRAEDRIAVLTPDMTASGLTFDTRQEALSRIMESAAAGAPEAADAGGKEGLYDACYPDDRDAGTAGVAAELKARRRERLTLDALDALVTQLASSRTDRTAVVVITTGWRLYRENRELGSPVLGRDTSARDALRRRGTQARRASGVDRTECDADRVSLAGLNHSRRLREIVDRANRATVSFYPVSHVGLGVTGAARGPGAAAGEAEAREDSLTQLAGETDGTALLRQADVDRMVDRLFADAGGYYLLGYRSTNRQLDGRFRAVSVQSLAPGVQVRTRRGYRGPTADELFTAGAPVTETIDAGTRAAFRTRTSTWQMPDGDGTSTVWLVGEIDYSTRKQLAWTSGAQAEITVLGADGGHVASGSLAVPPLDGSFALRLPESGGLSPGEYALRVELRPLSGATEPLLDTLRLVVPARPAILGEPVLWRRGPSTGLKHLMTADPRFQRSERIRVEMATSVAGPVSARLLDRLGNPLPVPVQASMRDDPSGAFRWLVADAVLAPLAIGDYSIELSLAGATQAASFRVVP